MLVFAVPALYRDPQLQALFAQAYTEPPAHPFTEQVLSQTNKLRRRAIFMRVALAALLMLIAIPLEDLALEFTQLLIVSLVEIDNQLVAELLAPVNTVGGALSFTLLLIRAAHRKLFT